MPVQIENYNLFNARAGKYLRPGTAGSVFDYVLFFYEEDPVGVKHP
jgi:hypothetical protein